MKYCPMKFTASGNMILNKPSMFLVEDSFRNMTQCDKEQCAWYCTYPNGEGECAIHSLPGLFEGLQDIAKEIGIK